MKDYICEGCGSSFRRESKGANRNKFCSHSCFVAHRVVGNKYAAGHIGPTCFKPGLVPWNKGVRGLHLSPGSEFKPGCESLKRVPVGTERLRNSPQKNDPRWFIKTEEPNVWRLRAHVIWENANGPIPRGLLVHHIDKDRLNDSLSNLMLVGRAAHLLIHREKIFAARAEHYRHLRIA